jgi:hypothetical protein
MSRIRALTTGWRCSAESATAAHRKARSGGGPGDVLLDDDGQFRQMGAHRREAERGRRVGRRVEQYRLRRHRRSLPAVVIALHDEALRPACCRFGGPAYLDRQGRPPGRAVAHQVHAAPEDRSTTGQCVPQRVAQGRRVRHVGQPREIRIVREAGQPHARRHDRPRRGDVSGLLVHEVTAHEQVTGAVEDGAPHARLVLGVEDVASPAPARTDGRLQARAHDVRVQQLADASEVGPPVRRRAGQRETGHGCVAPAKMRDSW